ncbi:MAG: hypothetical protein IT272_07710 [Chitinophagales bacterium]|jgi:hypothetical protein|nr:hypothetical protein [Sphingobacteriales bacterium]MBP9141270.1 hypothetical protein [Chitinophagales bacterium]MBK6890836.1 hypothetical protein [Sphingobacteriales bacterium]MBK8677826.1 hypothetical protein [Sphingobacteriales bacterium]MBL0247293.1 hypothetical protein [Sphingobacteriales bacterium]
MSRLTPLSKLLIFVAIVVGLFFLVRKFFPNILSGVGAPKTEQTNGSGANSTTDAGSPTGTGSSTTTTTTNNTTTTDAGGGSTAAQQQQRGTPFAYTPVAPSGGRLKGVVELGSTGFNSFIINVDAQKNWELKKSEFGASLVHENMATDEDIKSGLRKYISTMLDFGVSGKDIHFVVSSGAAKADVTTKITKVLKGMGYFVNEVTPQKEAELAYKSVVPATYAAKSFAVDIGSANTKIAWSEGGKIKTIEASGSKYFQSNTPDETVYSEVKSKSMGIPSGQRATCFIIGGVPFDLAKKIRNGKERYTVLNLPNAYTSETAAKVKAGVNIYKAIADATNCKQFVFDWDANFTIGFLLTLP